LKVNTNSTLLTVLGLGPNSRVRGERARKLLGWQPKRTSVIDWIEHEMMSR
jgi:hypothetical protein